MVFFKVLPHRRVPVVFNGIICPSFYFFGNFSPPVAEILVPDKEKPFFLLTPVVLFYIRIKMIVPPLSALLPNSIFHMICDKRPFLGTVIFHQIKQNLVFVFGPGLFLKYGFCSAKVFGVSCICVCLQLWFYHYYLTVQNSNRCNCKF